MNVNLIRFRKNGSPKVFPLRDGTTIIGRQHDCNFRVPVMAVSKKHCRITLADGTLKTCDLNSHNGTYLNGKRLSNEEVDVQAGSSLRIGPIMFLFQIDGKPEKLTPPKSLLKKAPKAEAKQPQPPQAPQSTDDEETSVQQTATIEDTAEEQFGGLSDLADLEDLEKLDS